MKFGTKIEFQKTKRTGYLIAKKIGNYTELFKWNSKTSSILPALCTLIFYLLIQPFFWKQIYNLMLIWVQMGSTVQKK